MSHNATIISKAQRGMATYVLGAGASRHAGYPLMTELGAQLCEWARKNPGTAWNENIELLYKHYPDLVDLEAILTELMERPDGSRAAAFNITSCGGIIGAIQIAIPGLFNDIREKRSRGADLYRALARDWIQQEDIILTFNYDLACERALKNAGLWDTSDGYGFRVPFQQPMSNASTKVLKLHGSTSWLGILFGGSTGAGGSSSVYGPRPALFFEADFEFLGYPSGVRDPLCEEITRTGGQPALILPTVHKNFFHQTFFGREWEPFWNQIWRQAEQALESADRIVIIGYSLPPADERARELLLEHANPQAEILVFSGTHTAAICAEFRKLGFQKVKSSGDGHFEDFLAS